MNDAALPSRLREGSGVGTVEGIRRPTTRAQQLRRESTPAERRLWQELSASKLGAKFSRQMPVGPYICDFLSRSAMLAIELDGDTRATQVTHDAKRDAFLRERGLTILRFSNADVMGNLEGVTHRSRDALSIAPPPTPPASGRGEE
ncbi:endonuclease domain-containing protein [Sphingomonas jeddahensis]|uniref:DUF559 domain-containing protein n=1 Tax=Sphingomonas jeddahensis TaxID=1915074 RepID=A0A1V2EWX8_9SPHN|nr:DUF559 domain-containing protein [Sphingomonas jeddahensis]ONF97043.1 hypothetical protein SPHI_04780 [Sphingomonas jeddahensis]